MSVATHAAAGHSSAGGDGTPPTPAARAADPRRGNVLSTLDLPDAHVGRHPRAFEHDAEVEPGEKRQFGHEVGETHLGDPVEAPVTIVNGEHAGPQVVTTAAVHGDELNGVEVLQEVAARYDPSDAHGALVLLHGTGDPGSLRSVATAGGVPTVTVEMGKAHRFQPALIEKAVAGVENVLAEYGVLADVEPTAPKWRTVVGGDQEKQ